MAELQQVTIRDQQTLQLLYRQADVEGQSVEDFLRTVVAERAGKRTISTFAADLSPDAEAELWRQVAEHEREKEAGSQRPGSRGAQSIDEMRTMLESEIHEG